ncbi:MULTISPECIES: hypothetical protein [Candidatus Cardinium]|uniref:hypothetical protein n=1 Tax=Candidatus Cardinium TaxID=273135 RepID=UPI001FA9C898|nr:MULTISPECIES: hypothetical protein [Cardinium]
MVHIIVDYILPQKKMPYGLNVPMVVMLKWTPFWVPDFGKKSFFIPIFLDKTVKRKFLTAYHVPMVVILQWTPLGERRKDKKRLSG